MGDAPGEEEERENGREKAGQIDETRPGSGRRRCDQEPSAEIVLER